MAVEVGVHDGMLHVEVRDDGVGGANPVGHGPWVYLPDQAAHRQHQAVSIEFDDDKSRIDVNAIHTFLSTQAYWAIGRPLETQQRLVDEASRVVGLYDGGRQIGFCRAVTDGVSFAYLADVYVLPEYRRRGLGERLLRHMIDDGPHKDRRWLLHTGDMHSLYRRVGFTEPSDRVMERRPDP